jgi:hypothetical protein
MIEALADENLAGGRIPQDRGDIWAVGGHLENRKRDRKTLFESTGRFTKVKDFVESKGRECFGTCF